MSAEEDTMMLMTLIETEELEENEDANATYYDTCRRDVCGCGHGDAS